MTAETQATAHTIDKMTNAFLMWPLPEGVCADPCATKQGPNRLGTNLLTFTEARQMFNDVVLPHFVTASDARPIAAAPDLLAATEMLANIVDEFQNAVWNGKFITAEMIARGEKGLNQARAAIAKATQP